MIVPVNRKVLVRVEKEKDIEDKGAFKVVKTKKDSLLKGTIIAVSHDLLDTHFGIAVDKIIYFSAYGYEEVDGDILVDFDQIWAYEQ